MKLEFDVPDKYGTEFKDYMQAIFNQVLETLEQSAWPQCGDEYYYIDADGVVEAESWDDSFDDKIGEDRLKKYYFCIPENK